MNYFNNYCANFKYKVEKPTKIQETIILSELYHNILTLLRMGGATPSPHLPVFSANVGISPRNFLTSSFHPFATIV